MINDRIFRNMNNHKKYLESHPSDIQRQVHSPNKIAYPLIIKQALSYPQLSTQGYPDPFNSPTSMVIQDLQSQAFRQENEPNQEKKSLSNNNEGMKEMMTFEQEGNEEKEEEIKKEEKTLEAEVQNHIPEYLNIEPIQKINHEALNNASLNILKYNKKEDLNSNIITNLEKPSPILNQNPLSKSLSGKRTCKTDITWDEFFYKQGNREFNDYIAVK